MNDPARLLSCAGGLMAVSGVLMAFSASLPLAVLLWAAGAGLFAAASGSTSGWTPPSSACSGCLAVPWAAAASWPTSSPPSSSRTLRRGRGKHEKGTAVSDPCPGPAGGPRLPPPEALRRRRVRSWEGMAKAMPSLSVSGAFPAGRMENRPFPLTSRPGDDKMKC